MPRTILSIVDAKRAAREPGTHLLWVAESHAAEFQELGWVRLEPARGGGVMFLHRRRQQAALNREKRAAGRRSHP